MADENKQDKAPEQAPEQAQSDLTVDFSGWTTMAPIEDWQAAARASNFQAMSQLMAGAIVKWPYKLDPTDPASYRQLSPAAWKKTANEFGGLVSRFFLEL